jgi:hypothetical protein
MTLASWLNVAELLACLLGAWGLKVRETPSGGITAWVLPKFSGVRFCDRWRGLLLRRSWDAVVFGFSLQIAAQIVALFL